MLFSLCTTWTEEFNSYNLNSISHRHCMDTIEHHTTPRMERLWFLNCEYYIQYRYIESWRHTMHMLRPQTTHKNFLWLAILLLHKEYKNWTCLYHNHLKFSVPHKAPNNTKKLQFFPVLLLVVCVVGWNGVNRPSHMKCERNTYVLFPFCCVNLFKFFCFFLSCCHWLHSLAFSASDDLSYKALLWSA